MGSDHSKFDAISNQQQKDTFTNNQTQQTQNIFPVSCQNCSENEIQNNNFQETIQNVNNQSLRKGSINLKQLSEFTQKITAKSTQNIKENIEANIMEECTHKPFLINQDQNYKQIQNKKPAFERLFDLQRIKKQNMAQKENHEKQLPIKHKQNPQIIERLYTLGKLKQAAKRQAKDTFLKNYGDSNNNSLNEDNICQRKISLSFKQSQLSLANKLIKEYEQAFLYIIENPQISTYKIDYIQVSEILQIMGFVNVSERVESINFAKERALINYLWVCLEGAKNRGITYRNLLLFIFAIMGVQIDLPKHKKKKNYSKNPAQPLQKDVEDDQFYYYYLRKAKIQRSYSAHNFYQENANKQSQSYQQLFHNDKDLDMIINLQTNLEKIGEFDSDINYILNSYQIKQIQYTFYLFYANRLHTEKQRLSRTKSCQKPYKKPALSTNSEQFALNYENKIYDKIINQSVKLQQLGSKIQRADVQIVQREEKLKQMQQQKENQVINCHNQYTFTPQINQQNPPKNTKRHLNLFDLAKPRSQLRDKKTLDIEYEKNCDQCTFNPDLSASKNGFFKHQNLQTINSFINKTTKIEENKQDKTNSDSRKYLNKINSQNRIQKSFTNLETKPNCVLKRPYTGYNKLDTGIDLKQFTLKSNEQFEFKEENRKTDENDKIINQQIQLSTNKGDPLLFVDININSNRMERITIYKGQDPKQIAEDFIKRHSLDNNMEDKLVRLLEIQIKNNTQNNL